MPAEVQQVNAGFEILQLFLEDAQAAAKRSTYRLIPTHVVAETNSPGFPFLHPVASATADPAFVKFFQDQLQQPANDSVNIGLLPYNSRNRASIAVALAINRVKKRYLILGLFFLPAGSR